MIQEEVVRRIKDPAKYGSRDRAMVSCG